jgi:hypothetical protein
MNWKNIFSRRIVWTIALYKLEDIAEIFSIDKKKPFLILGEKNVRINFEYQSTVADPFLFVYQNRLFLFYEVKTDFGVGQIWAQSWDSYGEWIDHGLVLNEEFHLSYPHVFEYNGKLYMIPETASSGEVWLYSTNDFPFNWKKIKNIIQSPLLDPTVLIQDEYIYIFGTTREYELQIYRANKIDGEYIKLEKSITKDKSISRNGGPILTVGSSKYRISQNCSNTYGQNISVNKIINMSEGNYSEELIVKDLYKIKPKWMDCGYHHLSTASFNGCHIVAVDGMRKDRYLNTLILAFLKIIRI